MTKNQLQNKLQEQAARIHQLEQENNAMRQTLMANYIQTRKVLGIEQAAEEREKQRTPTKTT